MLDVNAVEFRYPGGPMLRFELRLLPGECLVVTGPSGVGKSTLLQLIAGFQTPLTGDIRWADQSLLGCAPSQRGASFLFQSNNLFDHLSAAQNIDLGLAPNRKPTHDEIQKRDQAMRRLGIDGLQDRLPESLSGGQQQRVALARALVSDRSLVLLDEPFSALDLNSRQDALDAVKTLQQAGKSIVLVSHYPDDITYLNAQEYALSDPAQNS